MMSQFSLGVFLSYLQAVKWSVVVKFPSIKYKGGCIESIAWPLGVLRIHNEAVLLGWFEKQILFVK